MKLTKKLTTEIEKFLAVYWESYISGDLDKWSSCLPEDYRNIGTTNEEIWNSRQEILDYTISVLDQMIGMAEVRNRKVDIIPYKGYFMSHELGDLYVKSEDGWDFYAPIRLSSLLEKTNGKWQVLHQHGSYPDSRTTEGEAFGFDALKAENKKLQLAVAKRTKELEVKNRELAIEASLERVRALAMGMQKQADLLNICKQVYLELGSLGFTNSELRNAQIVINNDAKKTYYGYQHSALQGSEFAEVPYNIHPTVTYLRNQLKKSDKAFVDIAIKGKKMSDWKDFVNSFPQKHDKELNAANELHYYFHSVGIGALGISSYQKLAEEKVNLLRRFSNVFNLAYQRYQDITQAEAQAYEARVEAALERVRARSMAMQKSEELADLSLELVKQVQELGENTWFCAFNISDDDPKGSLEWGSNGEGTFPQYRTPREGVFLKYYKAGQKGESLLVNEIGPDECPAHYEYLCSLPGVGDQLLRMKAEGITFPTSQIDHAAFFKYGYILFITYDQVPELHDVFKRFAKVFEQSYTRFLDLQKAEAQAREAEIELALERVRARTMAMQHSDELPEAAHLLFNEVRALGIPAWSAGYNLLADDNKTAECWMSTEGGIQPPFTLPYKKERSFIEMFDFFESDNTFLVQELNEKQLVSHYKYMKSVPSLQKTFKEFEQLGIPLPKHQINHLIKFAEGYLLFITYEPVPESHYIFERFTRVFEQTYSRFLDLQNAEAQIKEANIQLALERVRASTMAMKTQHDLLNVIETFGNQLVKLGLEIDTVSVIHGVTKSDWDLWLYTPDSGVAPFRVFVPYIHTPYFTKTVKNIEAYERTGDPIQLKSFNKDEKDEFNAHYFKCAPEMPKEYKDAASAYEQCTIVDAFLEEVTVSLVNYSLEGFSEEEIEIFTRFSKEFKQAYTRFLDLQKAEAQTREAQINLGVERVRAKALAMHKSEEIMDVVGKLKDEVMALDIPDVIAATIFLKEGEDKVRMWDLSSIEKLDGAYRLPLDISFKLRKSDPHLYVKRVWENKEDYFVEIQDEKGFKRLLELFRESGKKEGADEIEEFIKKTQLKRLHHAAKKLNNGKLVIDLLDPPSDEIETILTKMGAAFDLAYKRFEDLQKAESQAREAQIEAALERVRAKSMAMHTSENLLDTISEFFTQLKLLDVVPVRCGVAQMLTTPPSWIWTATNATNQGDSVQASGLLTNLGHPVLQSIYDNWVDQENYFPVLKGKDLADYYKVLRGELTIPEFTKGEVHYGHYFNFKEGNVFAWTTEPLKSKEVTIFERFSLVLSLTYRRYLDLQKAEAQAREAQIEAALERVRASSMAMHHSKELVDVALQVNAQILELGIKIDYTQIFTDLTDDPKDGATMWMASVNQDYLQKFQFPYLNDTLDETIWGIRGSGKSLLLCLSKGQKNSYLRKAFKGTDLKHIPEERQKALLDAPGWASCIVGLTNSSFNYGRWNLNEFTKEEEEILVRFAAVFEQAYTRFLDLQKAEAQAREAKIEAALERVRARSMAMHKSDELWDVVNVVSNQFELLDIQTDNCFINIFEENSKDFNIWIAAEGQAYPELVRIPYTNNPAMTRLASARRKQEEFYTQSLNQKTKNEFFNHFFSSAKNIKVPKKRQNLILKGPSFTGSVALSSHASITISNYRGIVYSEQENLILKRITAVFEQTYSRFLDLKKAEAQAREAQIEAALEKVRGKAMGMHSSEDLSLTVDAFFNELTSLNVAPHRCGVTLIDKETRMANLTVTTATAGGKAKKVKGELKLSGHIVLDSVYEHWKLQKEYHPILHGAEIKDYYQAMDPQIEFPDFANDKSQFGYYFFFNEGGVYAWTDVELVEEELLIFRRFTTVLSLTYRRFMDLKESEAQARESQIELSLERIRSQATSMKVSTDLLDIVVTMRTEFVALGHEAHYFWHMRYLPETYEKAMTSGDGTKIGMVMELPRHIHGDIPLIADWEKSDRPTVVYAMGPDTAVDYITKMITLGDFKQIDPQAPEPEDLREIGGYTFVMARTTHGEIGFSLPGPVPNPSKESLDTLIRFAGVFDLAYRRFEDLQIAEAQAKAAIKQSSLDRVRAEIASMRKTKDLERITPLLWKELGILGVPFFRCGVFIVDKKEEMVHAYLSNPSGASLAALHLSFDDPDIALVGSTIKHWKLQTPYIEEWTKAQFIESMKLFLQKGQIQDSSKFQASEEPPERLVLQLVPFKQGMLYAGSETPLIEEHLDLMKDLADAFAVAYARYEDFVKLEEAKKKVENTLTDLKSAQTQLVHAEKMASLGELTAGIAHEIQNPLNFVNNFSELNKELIEELREELVKGDLEEVQAITQDIVENEEKISHHGKRAEGIVKGMLQHSRANSGDKELTDINLLADEYLRLSYHGLRAKDKTFNADFETTFDETLPKVMAVSQDIGRVLLNLINNAFHACAEQRERASADRSVSTYQPLVTVSTKWNGNNVEIMVSDNGPGIPDEIKDKIFQPFFTTKATGEGTGLGLSLSYDIVTKGHGGTIEVESNEGNGTIFKVSLPIKAPIQ